MINKLTLVAIFAHPDDEAFGTGGTLAKYAYEGVDVHLITATLGEAGRIANKNIKRTQPLSILREQELRCACASYGIKELHLLGYLDGQTTIVPQGEAVYKLVKLLRRIKPQVVISFGPEGIYGHYDHLAIHRWATAAVQLAGETTCWPDNGESHITAKFYHRVISEEQVAQMGRVFGSNVVLMDGVPFPFFGYPLEKISTVINISTHIEAKIKGIKCHASQLNPKMPFLQEDFDLVANPWFLQETFILAHCLPEITKTLPTSHKEDDLFVGLRDLSEMSV